MVATGAPIIKIGGKDVHSVLAAQGEIRLERGELLEGSQKENLMAFGPGP